MKRFVSLILIVLLVLIGVNYFIDASTAGSKYALNSDLVKQITANVSGYTPLDKIPPDFVQAIIAVEDHKFYKHHGFDIEAIGRAYLTNLEGGTISQGGSTITQQLAKNLFLSNEKTYMRKIKELLLAIRLERLYTKNEILEMYINVIYYGSDAYGIQAASRIYFNKNASALTRDECAMLAGLPQAPSLYNPKLHPALALQRQKTVLILMKQHGN
ncbi:MAG TPA: biosynthetic peptidoglycan transglycosylase [Syntrophomonas sp.]|nr:biosynthetic peptidoglycan transglycosylase [Syntrophomonas sp.]